MPHWGRFANSVPKFVTLNSIMCELSHRTTSTCPFARSEQVCRLHLFLLSKRGTKIMAAMPLNVHPPHHNIIDLCYQTKKSCFSGKSEKMLCQIVSLAPFALFLCYLEAALSYLHDASFLAFSVGEESERGCLEGVR